MEGLKRCSKCNNIKSISLFGKDKQKKDGVYSSCLECKKSYFKNYYNLNKDRVLFKNKEWFSNNKEKQKEYFKKFNKLYKNKRNTYFKNRRKTDDLYRMSVCIRSRTSTAFKRKRWVKNGGSEKLLGCSFEEAKAYLEKLFVDGMSWENYGEWQIDHIIPISIAKTEEEMTKLCHFSNLQPLWKEDNLKKSNKI